MLGRREGQERLEADDLTCVRCLLPRQHVELDRMLWCRECREAAQARAMDRGWWVGGAVAAVLAAYIWIGIEPSRGLLGAWIGVTLAAFYLASRVGKELFYGFERIRNARAAEAVPPTLDDIEGPSDDDSPDGPPRINLRG